MIALALPAARPRLTVLYVVTTDAKPWPDDDTKEARVLAQSVITDYTGKDIEGEFE